MTTTEQAVSGGFSVFSTGAERSRNLDLVAGWCRQPRCASTCALDKPMRSVCSICR